MRIRHALVGRRCYPTPPRFPVISESSTVARPRRRLPVTSGTGAGRSSWICVATNLAPFGNLIKLPSGGITSACIVSTALGLFGTKNLIWIGRFDNDRAELRDFYVNFV